MNKLAVNLDAPLRLVLTVLLLITAAGFFTDVAAQQKPPRPLIVTADPSRQLAFGAFTLSVSGGTVTINTDGTRSATGDIFLFTMGWSYSTALFYVQAAPGTVISMLYPPPSQLTGSNGGTLTLQIDRTLPFPPIVATQLQTPIVIGGTLTVGNIVANPPGNYTGTFSLIFVQE